MGFSKSRDYLDAEQVDPTGPIELRSPMGSLFSSKRAMWIREFCGTPRNRLGNQLTKFPKESPQVVNHPHISYLCIYMCIYVYICVCIYCVYVYIYIIYIYIMCIYNWGKSHIYNLVIMWLLPTYYLRSTKVYPGQQRAFRHWVFHLSTSWRAWATQNIWFCLKMGPT